MRVVDAKGQPNPHIGMSLAVMKTSAPPVTISRTGQAPEYPTSSDPITVAMTTNQTKSGEERVYLRWSNDWFITSHIIEASPGGDGLTYTATIPPQPDNNSCFYTVLTSTADLTGYTGSGIIDDLTLALNGIFNALPTPPTASPTPTSTPTATPTATPTPTPIPPSITTQPANKTVTVGQTAKFSVTATGTTPLHYHWMKNGVNIPGATNASYTTPPTTAADNGSLFAVVVGNIAGSVTSNNAILTVTSGTPTPTPTTTATATPTATATATATPTATATATQRLRLLQPPP